jgi:hypothetical protein
MNFCRGAIAVFAVTNTVGAALSVARVYSQWKKKQQRFAPSLHSTRTRSDSAYARQPSQAEPEKSNVITIVMATAAVMAVASALLALAH